MNILALGHSSYILEMAPKMAPENATAPVRILVDPWLSDHVVGDLCGRFPRLRFRLEDLGPLDAVFITHSHTDHLDPYFLVRLWRETASHPALPLPTLLVPESLAYLEEVFRAHLPEVELSILADQVPIDIRGIDLTGFFSPEVRATNEDDVQLLLARNGRESFVAEADALFPFQDPDARATLTEMLAAQPSGATVFLTTKNEGDATMAMLDSRSREERERRLGEQLDRTYGEIHSIFAPPDEIEDGEDLWQTGRVLRLVGGQGICWPHELGGEWNRVLFPIRLADRVEMEREVAEQYGCSVQIEELTPGLAFAVEAGPTVRTTPIAGLEVVDDESHRAFDIELDLFESFPCAPLTDEPRDEEAQAQLVERTLNQRFLPWLIGARNPPIEHLLGAGKGCYRVRIRFGTTSSHRDEDWVIAHRCLLFKRDSVEGDSLDEEPDEHYWANDLEDFLDGRCDEFSTMCRHPLGGTAQRLWTCLGLPYLNNDAIERKTRLHFERASRGETAAEWVLAFHEQPG